MVRDRVAVLGARMAGAVAAGEGLRLAAAGGASALRMASRTSPSTSSVPWIYASASEQRGAREGRSGARLLQAQRDRRLLGKRVFAAVPEDHAHGRGHLLPQVGDGTIHRCVPEHGDSSVRSFVAAARRGAGASRCMRGPDDCSAPASRPSTFLRSSRPTSLSCSCTPMPWGRLPALCAGLIQATNPCSGILLGSSSSDSRIRTSSPRWWDRLLGMKIRRP